MWKSVFFVIVIIENCFIDRKAYFKCQFDFFWDVTVFYFWYRSSIDVDTIEYHVHPLHIIVVRNQEFFFFFIENISNSRTKDWLKGRL